MVTLAYVIHIITCLLMVVVVLLQVGKGATMGSSFGGGASSQTVFGSAGPATMLVKVTIALAVIFMLTSIYLTEMSRKVSNASIMSNVPSVVVPKAGTKAAPAPAATPAAQPGKAPQPASPSK